MFEATTTQGWISIGKAQKELHRFRSFVLWPQVLGELECGTIETRAFTAPPSTDITILDAASEPSSRWWQSYLPWAEKAGPGAIPSRWQDWFFEGGLQLNEEQLLKCVASIGEQTRSHQEQRMAGAEPSKLQQQLEAILLPETAPAKSAPRRNEGRRRIFDHEAIIAQAELLLANQPNISIGSAGASIAAGLTNPKTGKQPDKRGIERIIQPLWEGTNS